MSETPNQAARRLFQNYLDQEYLPRGLHAYTNEDGIPVYYKVRVKHPDGRKLMLPMHANGNGFQLGEPAFPDKKPLYALPGIVRALENDVIWVVEGEQKADALNKLGLCATTSGGAMSAP